MKRISESEKIVPECRLTKYSTQDSPEVPMPNKYVFKSVEELALYLFLL